MRSVLAKFFLVVVFSIIAASCSRCPWWNPFAKKCDKDSDTPAAAPVITQPKIAFGDPESVAEKEIDSAGGVIEVSSGPLSGFKLDIPAGAVQSTESVNFKVSMVPITSITGLPEDTKLASTFAIRVEPEGGGNFDGMLDKMAIATMPFAEGGDEDNPVMFYSIDPESGGLLSMGVLDYDREGRKITFLTGTFSDFVSIILKINEAKLLGEDFVVDTGFRPVIEGGGGNGWHFPNWGVFADQGGICNGMVTYAAWYFMNVGKDLYTRYQDGPNAAEWRDDTLALQTATRAQLLTGARWKQTINTIITDNDTLNNQWKNPSSKLIGLSIVHGLYVAKAPQVMAIWQQIFDPNDNKWKRLYSHAILAYAWNVVYPGAFDIYDPNNPGTTAGTAMRSIRYNIKDGFTLPYRSGTNAAAAAYQYNILTHLSVKAIGPTMAAFRALYDSAVSKFSDTAIFPEFKLTQCVEYDPIKKQDGAACKEGEEIDGFPVYEVSTTAIKFVGTLTGGWAQGGPNDPNIAAADNAAKRQKKVVNQTFVFAGSDEFKFAVDNQLDAGTGKLLGDGGTDGIVFPVKQGTQEVVFLSMADDKLNAWAAYKRIFIKSTASRSNLTITMTWGQSQSDVDLHIMEPDGAAIEGRHIYFSNTGGDAAGTTPFLDFDNTKGFGPEHYYASQNMTMPSLGETGKFYGKYKIGIHYYSDQSGAETPQSISWTVKWRMLLFADDTVDPPRETWEEGSDSGVLSAPDSGSSGTFGSGGGWSNIIDVDYPEPDPKIYGPDAVLPAVMKP